MNNEDRLTEQAGQTFVSSNNCNVCLHCESTKERCGHVIQRCHSTMLDPDADDGWPEVDGSMICNWYIPKYPAKQDEPK